MKEWHKCTGNLGVFDASIVYTDLLIEIKQLQWSNDSSLI
jgi:hypothetical protein